MNFPQSWLKGDTWKYAIRVWLCSDYNPMSWEVICKNKSSWVAISTTTGFLMIIKWLYFFQTRRSKKWNLQTLRCFSVLSVGICWETQNWRQRYAVDQWKPSGNIQSSTNFSCCQILQSNRSCSGTQSQRWAWVSFCKGTFAGIVWRVMWKCDTANFYWCLQ